MFLKFKFDVELCRLFQFLGHVYQLEMPLALEFRVVISEGILGEGREPLDLVGLCFVKLVLAI